ncbi:MAG: hypothetical protein IPM96_10295 [Ignavibacteria bacterium]|nr:hypothetical protein [Ignavibacteria bacterium]
MDFYKPVFPNREFKFDIKFVKEPDKNDNETISFSHKEFIALLAGDESNSGLLYTIKIEDIEDARKISVIPNESDKFIDIIDMDSTTFEIQVRLKSLDELKRNTGINSKGWNREVSLSPLGVILKDNSGTNHIKKTIPFVFKKFKK